MNTYDKLLEDIYASQYKINKTQVQNPKTGEWEWHDRKVRTKRIDFKNSKMDGKPSQEKDMKTENMVEASKTRNATTDFLRKHPVSDSEMVKKVSSCKRCEGRGKVWKSSRDGPVLPGNNQDIDTKRYTCGACKGVGFVKEEMEAIMAGRASATAATIETAFARGYAKAHEEYLLRQKKLKLDTLYERVDATPPDKRLVSLSETLYHEQCEARREYDEDVVAVYSEVLQHVDDLIKRETGK